MERSMNKLCEYIVQLFEKKGWTPKRLVIWLAVGWVFQILAGIGLITYLMTKGYLEYQKGSNGDNEGSSERNALRDWPDSTGDFRTGNSSESQSRDRTWVN